MRISSTASNRRSEETAPEAGGDVVMPQTSACHCSLVAERRCGWCYLPTPRLSVGWGANAAAPTSSRLLHRAHAVCAGTRSRLAGTAEPDAGGPARAGRGGVTL